MKTRKYVAIYYDEETQQKLREYCRRYSFDLTKSHGGREISPEEFDFHTTMFYTTSKHKLQEQKIEIDFEAIPVGFEILGQESYVPTIIVEHPRMRQLRKTFEEIYKMKDQWGKFTPHVSLSYNYHKDEIIAPLPDFKLRTSHIKIKDIH